MHSWAALTWVVAGAGFAAALTTIRPQAARQALTIGSLGLLAALQGPSLAERGSSDEPQHHKGPSTFAVAEYFLAEVRDAGKVAFVSNAPIADFARWTFIERFPERPRVATTVKRFSMVDREQNEKLLAEWYPQFDAVVSVDVEERSAHFYPGYDHLNQYGEHLQTRTGFSKAAERRFPEFGCTVSIWRPTREAAVKQMERTLVR